MKVLLSLSALLAAAIAAPQYHPAPAPYHPAPAYAPAPAYKEAPAVYNYAYDVNDAYAYLNFGHNEARDGYSTQGEYHVQLPDGRLQTVKYHVADDYSGYVADVSYSGEAKYDAYKPAAYAPAPYHPAPAPYHPAPAPYKPAYAPAPYHG